MDIHTGNRGPGRCTVEYRERPAREHVVTSSTTRTAGRSQRRLCAHSKCGIARALCELAVHMPSPAPTHAPRPPTARPTLCWWFRYMLALPVALHSFDPLQANTSPRSDRASASLFSPFFFARFLLGALCQEESGAGGSRWLSLVIGCQRLCTFHFGMRVSIGIQPRPPSVSLAVGAQRTVARDAPCARLATAAPFRGYMVLLGAPAPNTTGAPAPNTTGAPAPNGTGPYGGADSRRQRGPYTWAGERGCDRDRSGILWMRGARSIHRYSG
jgi:hypothetical protein